MIVVAGDHGEELGKRGRFSHGSFLWDELVHVPLVVAGPGFARGRRVTQVVERELTGPGGGPEGWQTRAALQTALGRFGEAASSLSRARTEGASGACQLTLELGNALTSPPSEEPLMLRVAARVSDLWRAAVEKVRGWWQEELRSHTPKKR